MIALRYLIYFNPWRIERYGVGNIRCSACKAIISDKEKICPICSAKTKSLSSRFSQIFLEFFKVVACGLLLIVLVIGGSFLWSIYGASKDRKQVDRASCSEGAASEMAMEFIRARLGPSADPVFTDPGGNIPRAKKESGCRFMTYGKVSAIVGGQRVRSGYIVQVFREDTQDGYIWRLKDITFTAQ
ncbi:hypothetical protein [Pseudomonas sp. O11]|uniref:hypothetical protein n=1 Tax=Pseudomonas sp. O11 TaxID=3159446 RepID=UPI00387B2C53